MHRLLERIHKNGVFRLCRVSCFHLELTHLHCANHWTHSRDHVPCQIPARWSGRQKAVVLSVLQDLPQSLPDTLHCLLNQIQLATSSPVDPCRPRHYCLGTCQSAQLRLFATRSRVYRPGDKVNVQAQLHQTDHVHPLTINNLCNVLSILVLLWQLQEDGQKWKS